MLARVVGVGDRDFARFSTSRRACIAGKGGGVVVGVAVVVVVGVLARVAL